MIENDIKALVQALDTERIRQDLTKARLAIAARLPKASMRRLLSHHATDIKLSTVLRIAEALGATIKLDLVDTDLTRDESNQLLTRIRRRHSADEIAGKKNLDPGDVEHALFNLTLTPTERLTRSLSRAGLRRQSR